MESKELKLQPKILRIIKALRVSNSGYKKELESQVKANKELAEALKFKTGELEQLYSEFNLLKETNLELEGRVKELTEERDHNILPSLNNSQEYQKRIKELIKALRERKVS